MIAVLLLLAVLGSTPISPPAVSSSGVMGKATWYRDPLSPDGLYGAIDRKDTPWDVGDTVTVTSGDKAVTVTIRTTCLCHGERVIDLSPTAFEVLGDLGQGVLPVTVTEAGPAPTLPPTDTEGAP